MTCIKTTGAVIKNIFSKDDYSKNPNLCSSTLAAARRIYERVPNPYNTESSNVGIVVGRVQSGKTANAITLSALAFDNGHRLVVALLGNATSLLDQNARRFSQAFEGAPDVIITDTSTTTRDFEKNFDSKTLNSLFLQGKRILICSLKHSKHINLVSERIKKSFYKDSYALVIDDESDATGQNTKKTKFSTDDNGHLKENDRTPTNKSIVKLKDTFKKLGFISLTATPQVNILLQTCQEMSPKYCVTLEPGNGYTGLSTFHDTNSAWSKAVNDFDILLDDTKTDLPSSLMDAIHFFIAGCIIRKNETRPHSMMIHPSKVVRIHNTVSKRVQDYLTAIDNNVTLASPSGKSIITAVLGKLQIINPRGLYTVESVRKDIMYVMQNYKLHVLNSSSKNGNSDLGRSMSLTPYHIVIGGELLNRGLTINGLAVTYIIRMAKTKTSMDTLLQRARWFGYKQDYIHTCMVYMPSLLKNQYEELIETEDEIWQFLYNCDKNRLDPSAMLPYFTVPVGVDLTASNKANHVVCPSSNKSQLHIPENPNNNASNKNLINTFFDWSKSTKMQFKGSQIHERLTVSKSSFDSFLKQYSISLREKGLNEQNLRGIMSQLGSQYIDVVYMRKNIGERRSTNDFEIKALLQGRSDGNPSDPNYYVGDRDINNGSNLMIQIHRVMLKNDIVKNGRIIYKKGDEVFALAALLPKGNLIGNRNQVRKPTEEEIIANLN